MSTHKRKESYIGFRENDDIRLYTVGSIISTSTIISMENLVGRLQLLNCGDATSSIVSVKHAKDKLIFKEGKLYIGSKIIEFSGNPIGRAIDFLTCYFSDSLTVDITYNHKKDPKDE